jgi:ABC-type sugar transport system substrate-binding protein
VNSTTSNTDALAAGYVGSNDVQAGEMMAQFIQSKFPNGGSYAHLMGPIGNSAQIDRTEGVHNVMDKDSKWKLLDEQTAEWQGDKAASFAQQWNTKYTSTLNAVICDNDDMSVGAQNVLNGLGRTDVICVGVDGIPSAFQMVKEGSLQASIFQDGVGQVTKALELLGDLINGKTIAKRTMVPFVQVTKANVDQYLN